MTAWCGKMRLHAEIKVDKYCNEVAQNPATCNCFCWLDGQRRQLSL
mgnify:CR=1 FL=1